MKQISHQSGFIHFIGLPNAGKSTLFNALLNRTLSIATKKPQTTRQNIVGIDSGPHHQMVYIDTPGYLEPHYALQESMMKQVKEALISSDILVWLVDATKKEPDPFLLHHYERWKKTQPIPFFLVLNKIDLIEEKEVETVVKEWEKQLAGTKIIPIAALQHKGVGTLKQLLKQCLPEHPAYYTKDILSDRPQRFFAAEMIRKAIFIHYKQEIPYCTEVVIDLFKEKEHTLTLHAVLYVERKSQKGILIGKGGLALKQVGISARKALEKFFKKKVILKQHVKVLPHWRLKKKTLYTLGYR